MPLLSPLINILDETDNSIVYIVYVCCIQEGLTSLMLATNNGHAEVVKELLDAKADPNLTDKVIV